MEVLFCKNAEFFKAFPQNAQGFEEKSEEKCENGGDALRRPASDGAEEEQVCQPPQQHPQQHEQPKLPPAGDAAQEEKQHRRQKGIGKVEKDLQLFQPEAAQECRHQLIEKTEGYAAAQAQQSLQALLAGIDAHQPSSFPRKPRRCSRSSE